MDPVHRTVARFLRAHDVSRARPLLIAASGGADSMSLLHVLSSLGQKLGVAHVHHGLRGSAADVDLELVAARARALGVPFVAVRVAGRERDSAGALESPEARLRALRYAALEKLRCAGGYAYVATAHTVEDQAETVLLRAIRGSDLAGLAAIAPIDTERRLLRPLLDVRRAAVRAYLTQRRLTWSEDETNAWIDIPRNRLRIHVLPELELAHPGAIEHLARLAQSAHAWRFALSETTKRYLEGTCRRAGAGLWIDARRWRRQVEVSIASAAERRAIWAELLRSIGLGERLSHRHLERIDAFVRGAASGKRLSLPGRIVMLRDFDRFWLGPEPGPLAPAPLPPAELKPRGALSLHERDICLAWQLATGASSHRDARLVMQCGEPPTLRVRSLRVDDRWPSEDPDRSRRLCDVLARRRWPQRIRDHALVIEDARRIVGVVGLDRDAGSGHASDWRSLTVMAAHFTSDSRVSWELRAERVSAVSST